MFGSFTRVLTPPGGAAAPCAARLSAAIACGTVGQIGGHRGSVPGGLVSGHRRGGAGQLARHPARPPRHSRHDEIHVPATMGLERPPVVRDFIEVRLQESASTVPQYAFEIPVHSIEAVVIETPAQGRGARRCASRLTASPTTSTSWVSPTRRHRRANPTPTGHRRRKARHDLIREHRHDRAWGASPRRPSGLVGRTRMRWTLTDARPLQAPTDARRRSRTRGLAHLGRTPSLAEMNRLAKICAPEYRETRLRHRSHQRAHRRHRPDHQSRQTPRLGYTNADNHRIRVLYRCA